MINETDEDKVYWVSIKELENSTLAPNVLEYLKVFLDNDINEAYITSGNDFNFLPEK
ncbi:MAG: hypothetical protein FWH01_04440 [Oscillospiraceae bacterium]|nr:hypothetical protein [Oscillospiraceae bacterium]